MNYSGTLLKEDPDNAEAFLAEMEEKYPRK
jgi:hypothetical protein